jgi:3'-phosphoadenosine 5'-phosphosulfate sulfotransferase (PAPS reductase)/FAD synthetase
MSTLNSRGSGVVAIVSHTGRITFHHLYYRNGEGRTRKIGCWPDTRPAAAYKIARQWFDNPERAQTQAAAGTFAAAAAEWITEYVDEKRIALESRYRVAVEEVYHFQDRLSQVHHTDPH